MYIELDLTKMPVGGRLVDPDDFTSFKIVVTRADQAAVDIDTVLDLARERADDPEWRRSFHNMLAAAGRHGWIGEDGTIAAHVQIAPEVG